MRILFFVHQFPSLSQTFVLNQITGLIDLGHDVEIYAASDGPEGEQHNQIKQYQLREKIFYCPAATGSSAKRLLFYTRLFLGYVFRAPALCLKLLRSRSYARAFFHSEGYCLQETWCEAANFMRPKSYDVIYAHFGPNGLRALFLRRLGLLHGPIVVVMHGYDMSQSLRRFGNDYYRELLEEADLILPVSTKWKELLCSMGADPAKVKVHNMGVDTNTFTPTVREDSSPTINLLSVSRLAPKKGLSVAIRAVARLVGKYPNIIYNIVGDGPSKAELHSLVDSLGVDKVIIFRGPMGKKQVSEHLQQANIFLAPSVTAPDGDQEGVPVAIMEAMASGIPVVSTYHSGIPELIRDGDSGLLAAEGDVDSLVGKLDEALSNNTLRKTIGESARKRIECAYDIRKLNLQLADFLETVGNTRVQ